VQGFDSLGYVTLRFDMRGCGESEGERGRVICLEQSRTRATRSCSSPDIPGQPERIA